MQRRLAEKNCQSGFGRVLTKEWEGERKVG